MKRTKTPKKSNPAAGFDLVGEPKSFPAPMLLDLLKYAKVEGAGKCRWRITARHDEHIHSRPHEVCLRDGIWTCTCRQHIAGRGCAHLVAALQLIRLIVKKVPSSFIAFDFDNVGEGEMATHPSVEVSDRVGETFTKPEFLELLYAFRKRFEIVSVVESDGARRG